MKGKKAKPAAPMRLAADELLAALAKLGVEASVGIGLAHAGSGRVIAVRIADESDTSNVPRTWKGFPVEAECVGVLKFS